MPLVRASKEEIVYQCGWCDEERTIPVSDLVLGAGGAGRNGAPDTIVLPDCECGAHSNLCRTWDEGPKDSRGNRRRAINALAQHLRAIGQSHPEAKEKHDSEARDPPDMDELPDENQASIQIPSPGRPEN